MKHMTQGKGEPDDRATMNYVIWTHTLCVVD